MRSRSELLKTDPVVGCNGRFNKRNVEVLSVKSQLTCLICGIGNSSEECKVLNDFRNIIWSPEQRKKSNFHIIGKLKNSTLWL